MISIAQRIAAATLALLVAGSAALAQADTAKPKQLVLDNLRTPVSPAFELLGVSPTAVARPSTPRALATDLLSSTNNGSVIPNSYALEFAPYWLRRRPLLSFAEYTSPSTWQSIQQSFSISLATSRADTTSDTSATRVALGVRLLPVAGRPSSRFERLVASLDSIQKTRIKPSQQEADALDLLDAVAARRPALEAELQAAVARRDSAAIAAARKAIAEQEATADSARAVRDAAVAQLQAKADSQRVLATAMGEASAERVGSFLAFAAAVSEVYPGNTVDGAKVGRFGVWTTYSYRIESPHLDVIGLLRFIRDMKAQDQNALDAGARLLWLGEALGVSGEWVHRTAFDVGAATSGPTGTQRTVTLTSSSRTVGIVDYRTANDVYVTVSLGEDFKALGVERRPLVATFGLQLLYGDKPAVKLP